MFADVLFKTSLLLYILCFALNPQADTKQTSPLAQDSVRIKLIDSTSIINDNKTGSSQSELSKPDQQPFSKYKLYIELFSALLTPLIAIITTYIAFQQWRTNRLKLRHDRYERRLTVFKAVTKFIAMTVQTAYIKQEELFEFSRETSESYFLFKDDIPEYIDALYKKCVDLHYLNNRLHGNSSIPQDQRMKFVDKEGELLTWFGEQFKISRELFSKYLRITE